MKSRRECIRMAVLCLVVSVVLPVRVDAHPGSGIAVDRHGNVYFVDTGSGVWKVDRNGHLSRHGGPAYHWMAIDRDGKLGNVALPSFDYGDATVTRAGTDPALILSSDFPVVVGRDGALVYPWRVSSGPAGRLQVFHLSPSGQTSVLVALPDSTDHTPFRWLNGIAVGPDGSIYFTENRSVRRISPQGRMSTVTEGIALTGCSPIPGMEPHLGPYLRGLDVDSSGTIYVAASGCGRVLKIAPGGQVTTVLHAASPWSPTGIAVHGKDVYVLEYIHTPGDNRREWLPRVRKLSPDSRVSLVAEITQR